MEKLQKVMAHAGIASRRKSEELIKQGRVKINGKIITEMGTRVRKSDTISVDDIPIEKEQEVHILLNKPRGTVSTVKDPEGRKTVLDLMPEVKERIYPVGRLDYDTTGALLLTNDGELANKLMHPRYEFEKTYVAKVKGRVTREGIQKLKNGVKVDGKMTAPAKAAIMNVDTKTQMTMVELSIHEGKNHQVKKMMEAIGHPVEKLTREKYGFLTTEGLQSGKWRYLTSQEISQLYLEVNR